MPTRRQLIQKIQLNSNASSVTFSNIPGTYTDLMLVCSLRNTANNGLGALRFNGDTGSTYSYRALRGNGSTATSFNSAGWVSSFGTGYDEALFFDVVPSGNTASTFCSTSIYIPNYAGSTNKSVSIKTVEENNATAADMSVWAGLWSSTAAITSIRLLSDPFATASDLATNSSAYLYGITHVPIIRGGEVSIRGGFKYHTFRSTGTLQVVEPGDVEYLVVAGGGGGGSFAGGGGGAGGYRCGMGGEVSGGGLLSEGRSRVSTGQITVTVGGGGTGGNGGALNAGVSGSNSSFSGIVSIGGGGGGTTSGGAPGGTGGSGGGGGADGSIRSGGAGTSGQGYSGASSAFSPYRGGGGGGAGSAGAAISGAFGGAGGNGVLLNALGLSIAGGGAGGGAPSGGGGNVDVTGGTAVSGGGRGGNGRTNASAGTTGIPNTGGGGGGGGSPLDGASNGLAGGNGGSGTVIIRYPYDGN